MENNEQLTNAIFRFNFADKENIQEREKDIFDELAIVHIPLLSYICVRSYF